MAFTSCPSPSWVANCAPSASWSAGGIDYTAFQLCDSVGQLYQVVKFCDGSPSGTEYYTLDWQPYTPVGPLGFCSGSGGNVTFNQVLLTDELLCLDTGTGTPVEARRIVIRNTAGAPTVIRYEDPEDPTITLTGTVVDCQCEF